MYRDTLVIIAMGMPDIVLARSQVQFLGLEEWRYQMTAFQAAHIGTQPIVEHVG